MMMMMKLEPLLLIQLQLLQLLDTILDVNFLRQNSSIIHLLLRVQLLMIMILQQVLMLIIACTKVNFIHPRDNAAAAADNDDFIHHSFNHSSTCPITFRSSDTSKSQPVL